jgi:hypothetical protein
MTFLMVKKLRLLNGWQRLWVVCSAAFLIYQAGMQPLVESNRHREALFGLYKEARLEFSVPHCKDYQTSPFATLSEPKGNELNPTNCAHIWRTRAQSSNPERPYLEEDLEKNIDDSVSRVWRWQVLFGLIQAFVFSALLYFAGWIISWIHRGFKQNEQQ